MSLTPTNSDLRISPRGYEAQQFQIADLVATKRQTVSICLPAKQVAKSIGPIVEVLSRLGELGLIDQIVVVDAASTDGTATTAAAAGAEVFQEAELLPAHGRVLGKGDAMWRSLAVLRGELICYIDADTEQFSEQFVAGLLGPLLVDPDTEFVKGHFQRPFRAGETLLPSGGGRVTELTARPLLNMFYPALAGFSQPLAGEVSARATLLHEIPFATGYAVETGMLIDVWQRVGIRAMAQVDLGVRQNQHQALGDLVPMAHQVLQAVADRLEREGRLTEFERDRLVLHGEAGPVQTQTETIERPPFSDISESAA